MIKRFAGIGNLRRPNLRGPSLRGPKNLPGPERLSPSLSRHLAVAAIAAFATAFVAAWGKDTANSQDQAPTDQSAAAADASDLSVRLHPVKMFSVDYNVKGMETGTTREHWRNWGQKRVEIKQTSTRIGGISQDLNERIITDGPTITTVDVATRSATRMENPMYASLVRNLRGSDPAQFGKKMLTAMGGQPTGESREYAGEGCQMWRLPNIGTEQCVTSDGITVFVKTDMMGVGIEKTATDVRRGDGGPDAAFELGPDISVSELPSLLNLMSRPPE